MFYYVYILKSQTNSDIYTGSTIDLNNRLKLHNSGRVKSTKAYKPWKLLESHQCDSRAEAVKLEKFFKTHQQRELIKKRYL